MRRAVAAAGWAVLVVGCEQPRTELVARVDSEVAWGAGRTVQSVTLTVRRGGPTGPLRSARTTALGTGGERRPLPMLVGIVPTDDTDTPVWIEALGCGAPNGCTAATAAVVQRAVVRFAVGQTQEVPLLLASACVGVTCGSDERCGTTGRCEPATRAQTMVVPLGTDAGATAPGIDANRPDIGSGVDVTVRDVLAIRDIALTDRIPTGDSPCGAGESYCAGSCLAVTTDPLNCGRCNFACPSGYSCEAGTCRCPASICDAALGVDATIDVLTDAPAVIDVPPCDGGALNEAGACALPICPAGMRLIPAGQFQMGSTMIANERPVHGVRLSAFCMDETEVTLSAYRACVTSGGCTAPDTSGSCNWMSSGREDHPVNCVSWTQAREYCHRIGGDIPTEAQWEYAARGMDGRTYPWGNDAPSAQLCWRGGGVSRSSTCPVRSFPSGNSPFGIYDMAGNVIEWTIDWYGPYDSDAGAFVQDPTGPAVPTGGSVRVYRGGSWSYTGPSDVRVSKRSGGSPGNPYMEFGFRCSHSTL